MDPLLFLGQANTNFDWSQSLNVPNISGGILAYLAMAASLMVCANKLGVADSWMAWVPILNIYYLTKVASAEWWWFLVALFPCFAPFVIVFLWWKIFERRGKSSILSLLLLVPCVNLFMLYYVATGD